MTEGLPTSCAPIGPTVDASCDGVDDDCDGETDEDYGSTATTCGVGACASNTGSRTCSGGAVVDTCDPLAGAAAETCNDSDDDCDGETDEGLGCDDPDPDAGPDTGEPTASGSADDGGCHGGGLDPTSPWALPTTKD